MLEKKLNMKLLKEKYGVCRLDKKEPIPNWGIDGEFYSITKTEDELSIVCLEDNIPEKIQCEKEWRVLKIEGPLDFSLVGILAAISNLMAKNSISIFAISTYDTDYILVKEKYIDKAIMVLVNDRYEVARQVT
ncbi:ACT domain-containing protein [Clostridium gasigenes]|uniref:ACT domain-containing protein n=1 Tax=Clostridium gasigenes TaxID=94869 RepID=UPI0014385B45|nr:ACT domain-containing protein [Clostridium gasigenes]NKF08565.1 ACT domain-containing protein [Clostridium gasigenes]QSW19573.1 ACT domain-containing protein [Clostridium gasigenes]